MDDLPELPFEKVLSYLSLEDRLKSRAVSRAWRNMIDRFRVKSLCYSLGPSGFIYGKNRWVSGAFSQNLIGSTRFECFFNTFGPTILFNLKHLRLCGLCLKGNRPALASTIQLFGQLEQLDLINVSMPENELELNLPILNSIHFDVLPELEKLTLNAPRLQEVKILNCLPSLRLNLVHDESVERLLIDELNNVEVKKFKNLKHLYTGDSLRIESTLLPSLEHLREFHLNNWENVSELFEQKRRYDRADLKIFYLGLLLNGPDDPAMSSDQATFRCLAENPSRLADEIPFCMLLFYSTIEPVTLGLSINILKRFTDLSAIAVNEPVLDIQRFLDFLKNLDNIVCLDFSCDQPELFDRLPEYCAVQALLIRSAITDFRFLFGLQNLIHLKLNGSIDAESVRKVWKELQFLSQFVFKCNNKDFTIVTGYLREFQILFDERWTNVPDLNSAIQFLVENT